MYLGQILLLQEREHNIKLIIGVERGYETQYIPIRTKNKMMLHGLKERDKVAFTGIVIRRDKKSVFELESIIQKDFESCNVCDLPKTSTRCISKHDKEAQRLQGQWTIVHKIENETCIKIFFDKANFVFAAVATPAHWFHHIFKNLLIGDEVELEGWRYKTRTSLRYLKDVRYENLAPPRSYSANV